MHAKSGMALEILQLNNMQNTLQWHSLVINTFIAPNNGGACIPNNTFYSAKWVVSA